MIISVLANIPYSDIPYSDIPYKIILLLHVLTALVAFSPMFVYPLLPGQMRPIIMPEQQRLVVTMFVNMRSLYGPALIITGLLGFALTGVSNGAHSMRDGWIIVAAIIWVIMNGIFHAMILPALKTMGAAHLSKSESYERLGRREAKQVSEFATGHLTEDAITAAKSEETPVAAQIATPDPEQLRHRTAKKMVAYTTKNLQRGSAIMTVLLIVELGLMIWQPNLFQL